MKFFFLLLIAMPVFAVETDVAKLARLVKQRKEELKMFREKVSKGDKCRLRDYDCFSREVLGFVQGNSEDLIEAPSILEPFYERSIKDAFPPCSDTCENTLLAQHVKLYLDFFNKYDVQDKESSRIPVYPTVSSARARVYLDLSAFQSMKKNLEFITKQFEKIDFGKVIKPELSNKKVFEELFKKLKSNSIFSTSVVCHLEPGDPIHAELTYGTTTGKKVDSDYSFWFDDFSNDSEKFCKDTTPLIFRGTDDATRAYYRKVRDRKLESISCSTGDFNCMRKFLRLVGIHYAEDVEKVAAKLITFLKSSRVSPCDDTCQAQSLVRMIQTWITFLSTYDREKLASTMDWKEFPEERFETIREDVEFYRSLKRILTPIITTYGKIDPQNIKEASLRSELRSVAKDLSDFASGKMLKDSVICTMEPWEAKYDKYLSPYKDKVKNKKFEESFLEFKANICK